MCDHRMDSAKRQGKAFADAGDAERARQMGKLVLTHKETRTKYVSMQTTVTQMVVAITASHDSVDILKHYKLGNETLHSVLSGVDVNEVDEVLDNLAERLADAQELQDALSVPLVEPTVTIPYSEPTISTEPLLNKKILA